jgi:choline dehydrogenase-like flavoprotein
VIIERGRATGVTTTVTVADGRRHALTVRAGAVVVAAGAICSPAILARSGVANRNVGRGLKLHPASAVVGFFKERVEPWTGAIQTRYSDQLADQDGKGYGAKFETAPMHFALPASAFGWEGPEQMRETIGRLAHLSLVGILLRDRDGGRVVTGRDGRARVEYELSNYDAGHLRAAVRAGAQVLAAAGATEVMTIQTPPVRARPGDPGWLDRFGAAADAGGYTKGRMTAITFHQMASCAMGRERTTSVVGETGESHDVRGLYVADGSLFPTSSGVNPMLTIMALADHVARGMVDS